MLRHILAALAAPVLTAAASAVAAAPFTFASVDGGTISLDDWAGRPVLAVNTASRCGFAPQFEGLQALYDRYRDRGLVVLAIPSDDFNQELDSGAAAKAYCELTWGIDMPMTDIVHVKGPQAHPFYAWLRDAYGIVPGWNFTKVLIGPDGVPAGSWGPMTGPKSRQIVGAIEAALNEG